MSRAEGPSGRVSVAGGVASAALFLAAALTVGSADPWDPLAGALGTVVLLAASLLMGFVVGRWSALAGALLVLSMLPVSRAEEPATWAAAVVVLFVPATAVVIGLGVLARRTLDRHRPGGTTRRAGRAAFVGTAAAVAVGGAGVGVHLDLRVVDRTPGTPRVIDERAATIGGIGSRSSLRDVRARLGRPVVVRIEDPGFWRALDPSTEDPVLGLGTDAEATWRYPGVAVLVRDRPDPELRRTARGRRFLRRFRPVDSVVVTDPDAQTRAGVGIGDSLAVARRAYPGIACDGVLYGSDATNPGDPRCGGRGARGAISFAGDPISSITLTGAGSGDAPLAGP